MPTRVAARLVLLIPVALACSRGSTPPSSPLSVAGSWVQGARLQDAANGQTHIHSGYFSFAQRGDAFTGRGQQSGLCEAATGNYEGPLATGAEFQIVDGVQHGASVSFKTAMCTYQGLVSADGLHIDGTATCSYTDKGVQFNWQGDWLAQRER